MWGNHVVRIARDRRKVAEFLQLFGLNYDPSSDVTVIVEEDGHLMATGSLRRNVLQCFAVAPTAQGSGLLSLLVDDLTQRAFDSGHTRLFVFTTAGNAEKFENLSFRLLAETPWAALLEIGTPTIYDYTSELARHARGTGGAVGGLVVNCNPFTLGHQYLVEQASRTCSQVFVLVVEEEQSAFPFRVRLDLVRKGTEHLENVAVLPSGPYAVSLATFPSYFSLEDTAHARAGASIDATVFAKHIARALGIKSRFVGTEPLSPVTSIYNETLEEILGHHGINLITVPRLEADGRVISASAVRHALRTGDHEQLTNLLPPSSLGFVLSKEASEIVSRIRQNVARH